MIKILLYLSYIFTAGVAAEATVASLGDGQQITQLGFCEQCESKKVDGDDQKASSSLGFPPIVQTAHYLVIGERVIHIRNRPSSYDFIRAPPSTSL